jgi:hypothetical protein
MSISRCCILSFRLSETSESDLFASMFESGEIGTPNTDRVTAGSNSEDGEVNRGLGMGDCGEVVLA